MHKKDFPIFKNKMNGKDLVYLDNAATSQKPQKVTDTISEYYLQYNSNIHRGIYPLSEKATQLYNEAREKVKNFINASATEEIIFTGGTTQSLNFVANFAENILKKGDKVLITEAEHHSNLIPWQIVCQKTDAELISLNILEDGSFDLEDLKQKIDNKVKFVSFTHVSNVLGIQSPIKEITNIAKKHGAYVSIDGAQAVSHLEVNVQSIGCDFYSFSGHKMLGPTGIGVLYISKEIQESAEPFQFGGGMMSKVEMQRSTWAKSPEKYEAGTPNIAGAIGLGAAVDYINSIGIENIIENENVLINYAYEKLSKIKGLKILGKKENRTGLISFIFKDIHPHDIASVLSGLGICVRAGQHCAMPLHDKLKIPASTRASFHLYNTKEDVDKLEKGLKKAINFFK